MKTHTLFVDTIDLEKEVAAISPLIRDGLSRMEGPSETVLRAIHEEAVSHVFSQRRNRAPFLRVLAAAASLVLLLGGAVQVHLAREAGAKAQTLKLVLHIGAPHAANAPVDGTTDLAKRLLNIQGLDEETFFTPDEAEALSL